MLGRGQKKGEGDLSIPHSLSLGIHPLSAPDDGTFDVLNTWILKELLEYVHHLLLFGACEDPLLLDALQSDADLSAEGHGGTIEPSSLQLALLLCSLLSQPGGNGDDLLVAHVLSDLVDHFSGGHLALIDHVVDLLRCPSKSYELIGGHKALVEPFGDLSDSKRVLNPVMKLLVLQRTDQHCTVLASSNFLPCNHLVWGFKG